MDRPLNRLDELLWRRRILRTALNDQKLLVDVLPAFGYEVWEWEQNVMRLRFRLTNVERELKDMGYERD